MLIGRKALAYSRSCGEVDLVLVQRYRGRNLAFPKRTHPVTGF